MLVLNIAIGGWNAAMHTKIPAPPDNDAKSNLNWRACKRALSPSAMLPPDGADYGIRTGGQRFCPACAAGRCWCKAGRDCR